MRARSSNRDVAGLLERLLTGLLPIVEGPFALRLAGSPGDASFGDPSIAVAGSSFCEDWLAGAHVSLLQPGAVQNGPVVLLGREVYDDAARIEAFVQGWAAAVGQVFARAARHAPASPILDEDGRPLALWALRHETLARRARKAATTARELLAANRLGRYLAVDPGPARLVADRAAEVLSAIFPLGTGRVRLHLADGADDPRAVARCGPAAVKRAGLMITLQLHLLDEDGSLRDLKEQEVLFATLSHLEDPERVLAALGGWADAMQAVLSKPRRSPRAWLASFETLMPHDLVRHDLPGLRRPRTRADFRDLVAAPWARSATTGGRASAGRTSRR